MRGDAERASHAPNGDELEVAGQLGLEVLDEVLAIHGLHKYEYGHAR